MRAAPEVDDIGWPPHDYPMAISATRSDWIFVLTQLDRWQPSDPEDNDWFYASARQTIEAALQS
jgi:hypothetical protein